MGAHSIHTRSGRTFTIEREVIEATSTHRPDTNWRHVDDAGHVHQWHVGGRHAEKYDPSAQYETPTLVWVKTGETWYEDDDEPTPIGEMRCRECGAVVEPRYRADEYRHYIPGLARCLIDGHVVSKEVFDAEAIKEGLIK